MPSITKALIVAMLVVGLTVGGVGVVAADQPDTEEVENTESGAEFSVPEDAADRLYENNPNVDRECDEDAVCGRR